MYTYLRSKVGSLDTRLPKTKELFSSTIIELLEIETDCLALNIELNEVSGGMQ